MQYPEIVFFLPWNIDIKPILFHLERNLLRQLDFSLNYFKRCYFFDVCLGIEVGQLWVEFPLIENQLSGFIDEETHLLVNQTGHYDL